MINELDKKYLITTHNWFVAPDGFQYKSVFGTVKAIHKDTDLLGVTTNRHSTDWCVSIGNMLVAGCQVYYAIQTEKVDTSKALVENGYEGKEAHYSGTKSRIYLADD